MNTIIFPLDGRPQVTLGSTVESSLFKGSLVEIAKDYIIVQAPKELPLRGRIKINDTELIFSKKEETLVGHTFYAHLSIEAKELFALKVHFLARLKSEELTQWMTHKGDESESRPVTQEASFSAPITSGIGAVIAKVLNTFYKHPIIAAVLLLLFSAFPLSQLRNITIDPSLDRLLVKGSHEMKVYQESIETFGPDRVAILYFEDPEIFSMEKLKLLRSFAWELQKYPKAHKVQSLFTTSFIHSKDDTVYTEPAFQEIEDQESIEETLTALENDPLLKNRLFNREQNSVVFILPITPEFHKLSVVAKELIEKMEPLKGSFAKAFVTGEPQVELFGEHEMKGSQKIYLPLICLILLVSFFFFIRSLSAFFVTIAVTIFAISWSYGFMTFMGIPVQMMVSLVPAIVLTLSATEIIHIFSSYHFALEKGMNQAEAVDYIGHDIGKALFLTFSTTALGFFSILFSDILILKEFAIVAGMALVLAFVATLVYFPLHIKMFQRSVVSDEEMDHSSYKSNPLFDWAYNFFTKFYYQTFHSKTALIIISLIALVNGALGLKLYVDNDAYAMLSDRTRVKKEIVYFKEHIGGTKNIHVVLELKEGETQTFDDPDSLAHLWRLHRALEKVDDVIHVESFASIMALLNREMISGKDEDYKVPSSKNLIAQYMLTLSRDDLDPLINPDKSKVNVKIAHDVSSSKNTADLVERLTKEVEKELVGTPFKFHLTSRNILNLHAAHTIVKGQVNSLITMAILIVAMLALFFKSFKIGLISLIPNLFPIFGLFGLMAALGIPLNIGTSIVAAITIGIAADDTIHLFSRYLRDADHSGNPPLAGEMTIGEEVIPILTTSLSLALSFASFGFARFIPLVEFGLLSAYVLVLAVISDLYIGPAILAYFISHDKGLSKFQLSLLIDQKKLAYSPLFKGLSNLDIYSVLNHGKVIGKSKGKYKPARPNKCWYILLKGDCLDCDEAELITQDSVLLEGPCLILELNKDQINHLSPRIFSNFCNN